jgi:hypothetical protein
VHGWLLNDKAEKRLKHALGALQVQKLGDPYLTANEAPCDGERQSMSVHIERGTTLAACSLAFAGV